MGGLIAALMQIYLYSQGISVSESNLRGSLSFGDRGTNANLFAFSLLLPVAICLEVTMRQNKLIKKILVLIVLGVLMVGIVITGSRGGLLSMGIVVIVYILFTKHKANLSIMVIIAGIVSASLMLDYLPFIMGRWGHAAEDYGGGRLSIWYVAWHALEKYGLFGAGLRNFPAAFDEFADHAFRFYDLGLGVGAHNSYIAIVVELGVIGLSLLIIGIIKHYRLISKQLNPYSFSLITLKSAFLGILVASFFGNFLWTKSFWLIWMMIMMHRNVLNLEEESDYSVAPIQ